MRLFTPLPQTARRELLATFCATVYAIVFFWFVFVVAWPWLAHFLSFGPWTFTNVTA